MIAAERLPLRSDPAKSQFLRPSAHGRIWGARSKWKNRTLSVLIVKQYLAPAFIPWLSPLSGLYPTQPATRNRSEASYRPFANVCFGSILLKK